MALLNVAEHLNFIIKGCSEIENFQTEFFQGDVLNIITEKLVKLSNYKVIKLQSVCLV